MASGSNTTSLLLALILAILNLVTGGGSTLEPSSILQTAKHWNLFTFNFQPDAPLSDVSFYNPMNILATGIAVGRDRIFIATPRLFSGVASTVNAIPKTGFGDSPVLQAYPDWSFSSSGRKPFNCSDLVLISVYRLRIDSCNRLWILDAGISRSLEDYEKTCPPKLVIVDLNTDNVVRRVDFPPEVLRGESLFTNLVVDETTSKSATCDDVFAYITDTVEPAIVVYDSGRDVTWRLTHPAMYPDPDFAESEILSHRFVLMDGIVGLTFDKTSGIVYFQPLATDRLFSISNQALRSGPLPLGQLPPVKLVGKKSSQGIGLGVSPIDGSLLFSPLSETAIASWNPSTNKQAVLSYDRERLQFVADITTSDSEPGVMYAISSKFHRFFLKNLNLHEPNTHILRIELPGLPISAGRTLSPEANHFGQKPPYNGYYQGPKRGKHAQSPTSFFTSSSEVISHQHQHLRQQPDPYSFEPVGIINYSVKNPFTALNQGETFPPSKENRDIYQKSFLDTLSGEPTAPKSLSNTIYKSLPHNSAFQYIRGRRSVKPEEEVKAEAEGRRGTSIIISHLHQRKN